MSDGAHSKAKLDVRVPPSKKDEWRGALDDGERLPSLVRRAVDCEIRNEYTHREAVEEPGAAGTGDIDVTEVTEQISELQSTVEAMQTQLDVQ